MKLYDEHQFFAFLNLFFFLMSLLWWCEGGVGVHRGIVGVEGCGGDVDGSREYTENANYICHMVFTLQGPFCLFLSASSQGTLAGTPIY